MARTRSWRPVRVVFCLFLVGTLLLLGTPMGSVTSATGASTARIFTFYLPIVQSPYVPTDVTIVVEKPVLPAELSAATLVTATVKDKLGPIPDYPVRFTANRGLVLTPTQFTDASGTVTTGLVLDAQTILGFDDFPTTTLKVALQAGPLQATGEIAVVLSPCNDRENNDYPGAAAELTLNVACYGSFTNDNPSIDLPWNDYYSFKLDQAGMFRASLRGMSEGVLYDPQLLTWVEAERRAVPYPGLPRPLPGTADELITVASLPVGQYRLRIEAKGPEPQRAANSYILAAVTGAP